MQAKQIICCTSRKTCINNVNAHIILDKTHLDRVKMTKFLGVTIDENLTWNNHIGNVSKKYFQGCRDHKQT